MKLTLLINDNYHLKLMHISPAGNKPMLIVCGLKLYKQNTKNHELDLLTCMVSTLMIMN